jgi:hypothetical protein
MEILFKAKRLDNQKWAYGYYLHYNGSFGDMHTTHWIVLQKSLAMVEVYPDTVSQFSGLYDESNFRIFANDLRKDDKGVVFRVYQTEGGFVIKADYWKADINDLTITDELIFEHLSDTQTSQWIRNSTQFVGNIFDNFQSAT